MAAITYERLKNNIAEDEVAGPLVMVTFRCPVTEKLFHSVATMRESTPGRGEARLSDRALGGLQASMHKVFPPVQETGFDKVSGKPLQARGGTNFDRQAHERAVVEAFEAIAPQFAWDSERKAFIDAEEAKNPLCQFDRQLMDHPIDADWERVVAARMLAAVAAADGKISDSERAFFANVLNGATGGLEALQKEGAPSKLELSETRPGTRATMLMLAYALALSDEHLDASEIKLLDKFARALGVNVEREEHIRHWASEKVIENMLAGCYADGRLDADEMKRIEALARNIGVNEALVAKIDVRVRKRLGDG
ncbi:MAG: hypothetical protein H6839_00280 [Planctomycetes bacterium]|nr:hypothetical protein [Planctomycetota bacterium]